MVRETIRFLSSIYFATCRFCHFTHIIILKPLLHFILCSLEYNFITWYQSVIDPCQPNERLSYCPATIKARISH